MSILLRTSQKKMTTKQRSPPCAKKSKSSRKSSKSRTALITLLKRLSTSKRKFSQKCKSEVILRVNLRVKLEGVRAKTEKCVADLAVQLKENSSKEYIGQEVRRSVKSNLKMYMEEVNKCKTDRAELR